MFNGDGVDWIISCSLLLCRSLGFCIKFYFEIETLVVLSWISNDLGEKGREEEETDAVLTKFSGARNQNQEGEFNNITQRIVT
uniref:Uncharacterized protein n=1 Tax=Rhizophora mucronata TaxID=61149 RepID=A0A2P2P9Z9_RHIMU